MRQIVTVQIKPLTRPLYDYPGFPSSTYQQSRIALNYYYLVDRRSDILCIVLVVDVTGKKYRKITRQSPHATVYDKEKAMESMKFYLNKRNLFE